MFKWLIAAISWFLSFWNTLPDKTKQKIIDAFVQGLDGILRRYYRRST